MPSKETRREHKEEVRQAKAAAARSAQRVAVARRVAVALVLAAVVGGGILLLTNQRESDTQVTDASGSPIEVTNDAEGLLAQAAGAAQAAGCTDVRDVGSYLPSDQDGSHEGVAPLADYPSIPPASGPHSEATVSAGVYDEPVDLGAAIHSLEHGAVIIWYAPSEADSAEVKKIKAFVTDNEDHTIVAPFDYPDEGADGRLQDGAKMAMTAWHFTQGCDEPSLPVVADFMSKYRTPPLADRDYVGQAPEPNVPI